MTPDLELLSDVGASFLQRCESGHWCLEATQVRGNHVVARVGDTVVGTLSFTYENNRMQSRGTLVAAKYRRRGIGTMLWRKAIEWKCPTTIYASYVSDGGLRLTARMRALFPKVEWVLYDDRGDRFSRAAARAWRGALRAGRSKV